MKLVAALVLAAAACFASTSAVWEMTSFTDFVKGKFDGVSLGRDGRLSLAPKLDTLFTSEQPVIWSVASGPDGALYAATGNRGRVFRIEQNGTQQPTRSSSGPPTAPKSSPSRSTRKASFTPRVLLTARSIASRTARRLNTSIRKPSTSGRSRWPMMEPFMRAPATMAACFASPARAMATFTTTPGKETSPA